MVVRMREVLTRRKVDVRMSQVCLSYHHQNLHGQINYKPAINKFLCSQVNRALMDTLNHFHGLCRDPDLKLVDKTKMFLPSIGRAFSCLFLKV